MPRPITLQTTQDIRTRIQESVVIDDNGCWIWQPPGASHGYGQIMRRAAVGAKQQSLLAHRVSYEAFVGPIPEGLQIDHLCFVPKCVNPEHLEPVTAVENIRRRDAHKAVSA